MLDTIFDPSVLLTFNVLLFSEVTLIEKRAAFFCSLVLLY